MVLNLISRAQYYALSYENIADCIPHTSWRSIFVWTNIINLTGGREQPFQESKINCGTMQTAAGDNKR